jgi:heme exporter protein A
VDNRADPARSAFLGHATFLYPGLTARANLAFWARMYRTGANRSGMDRAGLDAILDRVGLLRAAEEPAGTFSRGMAQRLSLARLFLIEPELLFLDEPDTGLDAPSRALLKRELAAFRERGASLVWVSHRFESDRGLADRVLVLEGRAVAWLGLAGEYAC